jgi:hypothetical protein
MYWMKRWKTILSVAIILAIIAAIYWFTMWNEPSNKDYKAVVDKLISEITDYKTHNEGSLPVSGTAITLQNTAGTYFIIDICKLKPYMSEDCAAVEGAGNDNCDAGVCQCNANASYIWLLDTSGKVFSKCVGDKCKSNESNGYQGIWP